MAYTSPTTRSAGDLITTSIWNTDVVDNIKYFGDNQTANTVLAGPSSGGAATPAYRALVAADLPTITQRANTNVDTQQSTTSTSYVDVTSATVTITTTGGDVLVFATCTLQNSNVGQATYMEIDYDGNSAQQTRSTSAVSNVSIGIATHALITGLSAASHTFKMRFRVSGGTGIINGDNADSTRTRITVLELKK